MGRAIDMEKSIDILKARVKKIEDTLDMMLESATTKKHVNLTEDKKDGKKKANNKTNNKSNK